LAKIKTETLGIEMSLDHTLKNISPDGENWLVKSGRWVREGIKPKVKRFCWNAYVSREDALEAAKVYRDMQEVVYQEIVNSRIITQADAKKMVAEEHNEELKKEKEHLENERLQRELKRKNVKQETINHIRMCNEMRQLSTDEARAFKYAGGWDYWHSGLSKQRGPKFQISDEPINKRRWIEILTPAAERLPFVKTVLDKYINEPIPTGPKDTEDTPIGPPLTMKDLFV